MDQLDLDNRRAHQRVIYSGNVTVTHDGDAHAARILNISAGGAGLQMNVRLPDSTHISVEIADLGLVPAEIVRQTGDGVGVKFLLSPEKEQEFIRQIARIVALKRREQFRLVN